MTKPFSCLHDELNAWSARSMTPRLWLRDDDAVADNPALRRLLDLCGSAAIPATLAVIPARIEPSLEATISGVSAPRPVLLVHGYAHDNHEPSDEKKAELGLARPLTKVAADTAKGLDLLRSTFPKEMLPVLVPPWNRIRPDVIPVLATQGYRAISTFGLHRFSDLGLPEVNTHVDIIDWRTRRGRDAYQVACDLARMLAQRRRAGRNEPIGILTHHAVHNETAWAVLTELSETMAGRVRWLSGQEVFDAGQ